MSPQPRATPWVNERGQSPWKGISITCFQMLMPFQGGCEHLDTQGVALGYMLVGLSGRPSATCGLIYFFDIALIPNSYFDTYLEKNFHSNNATSQDDWSDKPNLSTSHLSLFLSPPYWNSPWYTCKAHPLLLSRHHDIACPRLGFCLSGAQGKIDNYLKFRWLSIFLLV